MQTRHPQVVEPDQEFQMVHRQIAEGLGAIPEVHSVYARRRGGYAEITVLVRMDRYDDALMTRLLEAELVIVERFRGLLFDFGYVPVSEPVDVDARPPGVQLVLARR